MTTIPPSAFGMPVLRTEDPRFLRGEGRYLDNVEVPGALRAVFVRSILPHAVVRGVEGLEAARSLPGVVAIYTAADLDIASIPPAGNVEAPGELELPFHREALATDRVRFVGEPYAVVVAESLAAGQDAAESIWLDAEPLPAVTDAEGAMAAGATLLWPALGTNVAHAFEHRWDRDVLADAEVVVRGRFRNQRLAPVPMESNGLIAVPAEDGRWTVWASSQVPFDVRDDLSELLGVERGAVRVIAPDVGGGFGAKGQVYPEYLVTTRAAQLLGRPVRWSETRSDSMVTLNHGRDQLQRVEVGARRDGTLVGLRVEIVANMGAYPSGAYLPVTTAEMSPGVYRWPAVAYRGWSVVTNATPVGAYRGAGRPEAAALVERAIDLVADELGLDPVDVRRRNLVDPDAFPFTTATGEVYDSGEYGRALDAAIAAVGYEDVRAKQASRRDRGDPLAIGIGVSTYVEVTAFSSREFAQVDVERDGTFRVAAGTSSHGQGHETAYAQLAAAILAVPLDRVRVIHSDTQLVERGQGTWGSRSLQVGGTSVAERAGEVVEQARRLAAEVLEVDAADLEGPVDGGFRVAGAPERAVTWAALAAAAEDRGERLSAKGRFAEPGSTFPFGAHAAVVEVDLETGGVRLLRHVAVDDCGRILNPLLVRGQQHGGIAQGVAQALFEEVVFDEAANPLTANLTTYLMPSAADLPGWEASNTETPTLLNALGAKGIGESGSIGSTPAVQNAVVDALSHLGVRHVDLPCSPERVWRAIKEATGGAEEVAADV